MKVKFLIFFLLCIFALIACQDNPYGQGERIYLTYCATCHMENGEGLKRLYPPLAKSDYLAKNQSLVPCIISNGLSGSINVNGIEYDQPMAPIPALNAVAITNVINYINHSWGNDAGYTKITDVEAALKDCK